MLHDRPLTSPLPADRWAPIADLRIAGTDQAIRDALEKIVGDLANARLSKDDTEHAQIVLGEVLNNIVEHAFVGIKYGSIQLSAFRSAKRLRLRVQDNGIPMPNGQLPQRPQPRIDVAIDDLPEGGFGWHLIRSLTDHLHYERKDDANHLTLDMPVAPVDFGAPPVPDAQP